MSTIAFSRVEGLIALPRVMPFGRVLAPFGREWVLRSPTLEMSVLYAAVSRTFCLSTEMFHAMRRWDPSRADVRKSAPDVVLDAGLLNEIHIPQSGDTHFATSARPVAPVHPASMKAAGACAVGVTVVLAWMMSHYMAQHRLVHPVQQQKAPDSRSAAPPAPISVPATHVADRQWPAANQLSPTRQQSVSKDVHQPQTLPSAVAPATAPVPIHSAQRASQKQAMRAADARQRVANPNRATHAGPPVTTQRHDGADSLHRSYSPRQPLADSNNEYGSIVTLANPYIGETQPAARTVHSDTTDWAAYVTQQRITESPNQFSK